MQTMVLDSIKQSVRFAFVVAFDMQVVSTHDMVGRVSFRCHRV